LELHATASDRQYRNSGNGQLIDHFTGLQVQPLNLNSKDETMKQYRTVCESYDGHGDKWTELIVFLTGQKITARSVEEAQEIAEEYLADRIDVIMHNYTGPPGTEPTGLSGLVISVEPA